MKDNPTSLDVLITIFSPAVAFFGLVFLCVLVIVGVCVSGLKQLRRRIIWGRI